MSIRCDRILGLSEIVRPLCVTALLAAGAAAAAAAPPERAWAIVAGLRTESPEIRRLPEFVERDAAEIGGILRSKQVKVVPASSSKADFEGALRRVAYQLQSGDSVFVFVSGEGKKSKNVNEGYIYVKESNGANTCVETRRLAEFLRTKVMACRFYLFLDLYRSSEGREPGKDQSNITPVLKELRNVNDSTVVFVSTDGEPSEEYADKKLGVFAHALSRILAGRTGALPVSALEAEVRKEVEGAHRRQRPTAWPRPSDAPLFLGPFTVAGRRGGSWFREVRFQGAISRPPRFVPAVFPGPVAWEEEEVRSEVRDFKELAAGLPPQEVLAQARRLAVLLPSGREGFERDDLSIALEDAAQQLFARYGRGDEFPGDPLALTGTDFHNAAELFQGALALRADDNELRARMLFCRGRASGNVSDLERAAGFGSAEAENALGVLELEQRRPERAIEHFDRAVRRWPDWIYPRHNRALALTEKGEYSRAVAEYREAIRLKPHYPFLYCNLGLLLHRLNRLEEARRTYIRAIEEFEEQEAELQLRRDRLSALARGRGSWESLKAEEFTKRVASYRRNKAEALNALGAILERQGAYDLARQRYHAALKVNPDLFAARHNLGLLDFGRYHETGRKDTASLSRAVEAWAENVGRNPKYLPSLLSLAAAQAERRDYEAAARFYREAHRLQPDELDTRLGLANALIERGSAAEAARLLEAVAPRQTAGPFFNEIYGKALGALGRREDACRRYAAAWRAARTVADPDLPKRLRQALGSCPAPAR